MSECSTFVSGSPAHPAPRRHAGLSARRPPGGRVGRRRAGAGFGEPGILGVSTRDPGLMLGYWGAEEETRQRFLGEWFLTGDM